MEPRPEPNTEIQPRPQAAAMDVVAAPPPEPPAPTGDNDQPLVDTKTTKPLPTKPAKQSKPLKQPGSGVGMAIFATVIIVIALAALATFAYLKQNHSI